MPSQRFSTFSWALALFCLPSTLFPLTWFLSPHFSQHAELSASQIHFFSIVFWVYPAGLLLIAGILYALHKRTPNLAKSLLAVAFVAFYALVWYIVRFF